MLKAFEIIENIKVIRFLKNSGLYAIGQKVAIFIFGKRERLAKRYISGDGLEVGALDSPLNVSTKKASVTYIDRMDNNFLGKHYPELDPQKFVKIGIVDDGEKLRKVKNNSQDFVIANHFIEHCEDPITTLINHLRVLRNAGIVYWAVPNKNRTFDRKRSKTTLSHLWRDYKAGPKISRRGHYEEWVRYVLGIAERKIQKEALKLMKEKYSIHFHVWTPDSFRLFLNFAKKKLKLKFKIEEFVINLNEFVVVIRKND